TFTQMTSRVLPSAASPLGNMVPEVVELTQTSPAFADLEHYGITFFDSQAALNETLGQFAKAAGFKDVTISAEGFWAELKQTYEELGTQFPSRVDYLANGGKAIRESGSVGGAGAAALAVQSDTLRLDLSAAQHAWQGLLPSPAAQVSVAVESLPGNELG